VRFDGKATSISVYVFVGENESVARMCKTLTLETWSAIKSRFSIEDVYLQPVDFDVKNGLGFRVPESFAYGTHLFDAGRWASLRLNGDHLALSALTGISGLTGLQYGGPLVGGPAITDPFLTTQRATLYVVEDTKSGVILFIGSRLTKNIILN
jgi:hypothetical protein